MSNEMPLKMAYHQGLHYLLRQNQTSENEIILLFENCNLWPLNIYNSIDHADFMVYSLMENSIGLKKANLGMHSEPVHDDIGTVF